MGGKVMQCDFSKPETLCKAFSGCEYVFFVPEMTETRMGDCECAIECMRKEGVSSCIMLSVIGSDADAANFQCLADYHKMEKMMEAKFGSDRFCIMRCGFIQQMFLCLAPMMNEHNKMMMCCGAGKFAPINMNDICEACFCMVCGTGMSAGGKSFKCMPMDKKHHKQCYNLTGPECISGADMCAEFNEACLRDCKFESCTRDQMMQCFKGLANNETYACLCMKDEKVFCDDAGMNFNMFKTDMSGMHNDKAAKMVDAGDRMCAWSQNEKCYFGRPCCDMMMNMVWCSCLCELLEFCKDGHADFASNDLKKLTGHQGMSVENFFGGHKDHFMMGMERMSV
jgi:hypothetical protein